MHINESAAYHFNWEADFTKAERDWVMRNGACGLATLQPPRPGPASDCSLCVRPTSTTGMRIFRFNGSPELVLQQLVSTVGLFLEPLTQAEVGASFCWLRGCTAPRACARLPTCAHDPLLLNRPRRPLGRPRRRHAQPRVSQDPGLQRHGRAAH